MTRVLILGGTAWLGRAIAAEHLARGADVTCVARGSSGQPAPGATLVAADRDEPGAYDAVEGEFDEVVELTSRPAHAIGALDALSDRAGHWTLISTISVHRMPTEPGEDEEGPLEDPSDDPAEYGGAKVRIEQATSDVVGDRLLIVRPGIIAGVGDPSDRFGYWVARAALAGDGPLLVPARPQHLQLVDVGDLARWVVDQGLGGRTGTIDAVGDATPFEELVRLAREIGGHTGEVVAASDDELAAQGVTHWMGPTALPLTLPAEYDAHTQRANARYREAGAPQRPLVDIVRDSLADEQSRGLDRIRRSGIARDVELGVIDALA